MPLSPPPPAQHQPGGPLLTLRAPNNLNPPLPMMDRYWKMRRNVNQRFVWMTISRTTTLNGLICSKWTLINISNGIQIAWSKIDGTPSMNYFHSWIILIHELFWYRWKLEAGIIYLSKSVLGRGGLNFTQWSVADLTVLGLSGRGGPSM